MKAHLFILSLSVLFAASAMPSNAKPNIIIILSDDMGFSDIGCYGSEIETPNLDALAANGLRFTQFYNTGRCCPTRASLLTGLYPHQTGIGHMMDDRGHDGYRGDLNKHSLTIAEALRPAGYASFMAGKWHVTKQTRPGSESEKHNWPLQRGFDRFYGTIHGAGSFYDPNSLTRDNELISPYADPEYEPDQYYYTDAISDQAARFIAEHHQQHGKSKPFFLYVAYTAAHWPMHALDEDVKKYEGKYDRGYSPIRQARFEKMKKLGLIHPDWQLSPQAGDWNETPNKHWETRCMEVYAAMIDRMDQGIGRILQQLKNDGFFENTLIFFLEDNGGCAEGLGRTARGPHSKRPQKPVFPPMQKEELQFDMIPKQTRDGYPVVQGPGILPGGPDTYIAYGKAWANVSNTPFREYKHWVHEGGISTPLIVHWPKGIPQSERNKRVHEPGHLIDLMATCVDLAGALYPSEFQGEKIHPLEGMSLHPVFNGKKMARSNPLFWEHESNRAIRQGKWKLVAKADRPWELYDMESDRTEMNDLADENPELVQKLAGRWQECAARANVLPLGSWRRKN